MCRTSEIIVQSIAFVDGVDVDRHDVDRQVDRTDS